MSQPETQAVAKRRGKWSTAGIPHKGWSCVEIEDLGEVARICEMCESSEIRYAHHLTHPDHSATLIVGCVCAGHMEGDLRAARDRDKQMVSRAGRRRRWLTRIWRVSEKGNHWLRVDGFRTTVYRKGGSWAATVATDGDEGFVKHIRRLYPTSDAAKLAAFDLITAITGLLAVRGPG